MPENEVLDTSVIDSAARDVKEAGEEGALAAAYEEAGRLSEELAATQAELDRIRREQDIDSVKARLLEPYVNKVFNFVVSYCGVVGIFLFLAALPGNNFELPETILGIIAGSTAVSVIGLIGLVITGLFGSKSRQK